MDYSKCASEVSLSRDANANAIGDTFRQSVGSFPLVGGLIAGFVPDTLTQNILRTCPGALIDHTTDYQLEYTLLAVAVILTILYVITK